MDIETQLAFEGTKEQQKLAARAFEVMRRKGMLFSASAPIKMTLESLVKALAKDPEVEESDPEKLAPKVKSVLNKNEAVFARGDKDEYITTKSGRAPQAAASDTSHTFKQRMNAEATALDADAAKEYAASLVSRTANRAEKNSLIETIVEIPVQPMIRPTYVVPPSNRSVDIQTIIPQHLIPQLPVIEQDEEEEEEIELPAPRTQAAPVAEAVSPAPVPEVPARPTPRRTDEEAQAPAQPVTRTPAPAVTPAPVSSRVAEPEPKVEKPREETAAPQPVAETQAPVAAPTPVVAPKPKPAAPAPAPAPVVTGPVEVNISSPDGPITVDLNQPLDDILADEAVEGALIALIEPVVASDTRLIRFGSDIFPEEAIERFSKGDYRRIKEYLDEPETGGVASDRDIMAEVLNRRIDHPDYERVRFSVNYRMLKEKKDFEFVGIDTDRLWISANASPVPPPARKPAEIGQDYRFLEDPATASVEEEEEGGTAVGPLEYSLTYYEYENGVLPYDQRFKRIFPGAVFEDQRASLLRFEIPQLYGALLGELRYPTGNRGGFIMGLSELFTAHMVPGAKFTIVPTDRGEDVFEIHFTRVDEKEENLLQFDERRSRYVFRPVSYAVETDPLMLINQDRFGKLHNHKQLEDAERKRPDVIIANAFEIIGEENEGKLWAAFDEIYPLVNIDRPISKSWLKTLLSGAYPFFYPDEDTEGAYFYDQSKRPS